MNACTTQILIESMAVNAEVEGMIAENKQREHLGDSMAYTEKQFVEKANTLQSLANHLHELRQQGFAE